MLEMSSGVRFLGKQKSAMMEDFGNPSVFNRSSTVSFGFEFGRKESIKRTSSALAIPCGPSAIRIRLRTNTK